jgi:hypothetical protein
MVKKEHLPIIKEFKDKKIKIGNKNIGIDFITEDFFIKFINKNKEEQLDLISFLNEIIDYEYIFEFQEEEKILEFYKKVLFIYYCEIEKETENFLKNFFNLKKLVL